MTFNYNLEYCKERKAQSVHRENGLISILVMFFVVDLYANFIPVCTWLTYNNYDNSARVGQLKKKM